MHGIDYFRKENRQCSNKTVFGLCDDDDKNPAYISENINDKDNKWIGVVENESRKEIGFYPVDNCIEVKRDDGTDSHKCEGILRYDNDCIVFTELKDRQIKPSVWFTEAREQILETMDYFFKNYRQELYDTKVWISNRQLTNQNYFQQIISFKQTTKERYGIKRGYVLWVSRSLSIK